MSGGETAMARMKPRTWYFLGGFAFGVIASVLYLLLGTWAWGAPEPEWAQIVFAPASFVGFFVYLSLHAFTEISGDLMLYISHFVAIFTMGMVYGLLVTLVFTVKRRIMTKRSTSD
jgi:hypothetical protein